VFSLDVLEISLRYEITKSRDNSVSFSSENFESLREPSRKNGRGQGKLEKSTSANSFRDRLVALNRVRSPTRERPAPASEIKRASTVSFMRDPLKFHSTIGMGPLAVAYRSASFLSIAASCPLSKPAPCAVKRDLSLRKCPQKNPKLCRGKSRSMASNPAVVTCNLRACNLPRFTTRRIQHRRYAMWHRRCQVSSRCEAALRI